MANWHEILDEINSAGSTHDIVRRKYLGELSAVSGRNVIAYYSGWLQKPQGPNLSITDSDKTGFMNAMKGLDYSKGLDLILHTPGGETAATESIVDYLRKKFGIDIRAIIPQIAMSAGTMIACASKEIIMGEQSSLGPIDPQSRGLPTHGVLEEFKKAGAEIKADPSKIAVWQPIIAKYPPTLIGECEKSIKWSEKMVKNWLKTGMFKSKTGNVDSTIKKILKNLGKPTLTLSHARHLSADSCDEMGLEVGFLEKDVKLEEAVLSVHHAFMHTFNSTPATKIIENHKGKAFVQSTRAVIVNQ